MEAAEGQEVVAAAEDLSFRVTHRKEVLQVTLPASATVMDLHHKLQELTGIPQEMQKIMFKGGLKDTTKTLAESGIKNGVKMMLMGSKPEAVQALAAAGKAASIAPLVEQVQAQAEKVPMCQEAHHKKVLDKGKPADAEEGLPGTRAALPESLKGLLSGSGSKVRVGPDSPLRVAVHRATFVSSLPAFASPLLALLPMLTSARSRTCSQLTLRMNLQLVFKPMAGEFTIATAERTQKLPLGSFPDATSDPITDHPVRPPSPSPHPGSCMPLLKIVCTRFVGLSNPWSSDGQDRAKHSLCAHSQRSRSWTCHRCDVTASA